MMRALILAACCLFSLAVACGGDSGDADRIMKVTSGEYTEGEFRSLVQESVSEQDELYETICAALDRLSDDEAVDAHVERSSHTMPFLELVVADEKRAIQILREECEKAGLA